MNYKNRISRKTMLAIIVLANAGTTLALLGEMRDSLFERIMASICWSIVIIYLLWTKKK